MEQHKLETMQFEESVSRLTQIASDIADTAPGMWWQAKAARMMAQVALGSVITSMAALVQILRKLDYLIDVVHQDLAEEYEEENVPDIEEMS
jgi:hypothetical protein